jgi:hypothetical protein
MRILRKLISMLYCLRKYFGALYELHNCVICILNIFEYLLHAKYLTLSVANFASHTW